MTLGIIYSIQKKLKLYLWSPRRSADCGNWSCFVIFMLIHVQSFNVCERKTFYLHYIYIIFSRFYEIPYHLVYREAKKDLEKNILYSIIKKDVDRIFLAIPYYTRYFFPQQSPPYTHFPFLVSNISSMRWFWWPKQMNERVYTRIVAIKGKRCIHYITILCVHNEDGQRKREWKMNWNNVNDGRAHVWICAYILYKMLPSD